MYLITLAVLWFFQKEIWGIFTKNPLLTKEREWYFFGFFIMCAIDFWQVIFSGTFRALGKMDIFNKFNFISYFLIIVPLSIVLTFYVGKFNAHVDHGWFHTIVKKDGLGQMGVWYAFMAGLSFQLITEIYFIFFSINWAEAAIEAAKLIADE